MTRCFISLFKSISIFCLFIIFLSSCKKQEVIVKPDLVFYVLSDNNQLLQFNAKDAGTALSTTAITGLQSGEKLLSIDFRPATGQLYALGNTSRFYIIDLATGRANPVAGSSTFRPAINGTTATIDFDPTADRIRLVTNTGQNLRFYPYGNRVVATDRNISGVVNAYIPEIAYTNNIAGASTTVLYDLDATSDKLYKQDPSIEGKLVEVGSLNVDFNGTSGFDIAAESNVAIAALTVNNATALYELNLENGSCTFYNNFPSGLKVVGLAIPTQPVAYAIDLDNNLLIFNPTATAQQPVSKRITDLRNGEKIVGIDISPWYKILYGLGTSGLLYTIDLASGATDSLNGRGSKPLILTGTDFGFDIDPTSNRTRVVSNTGQNFKTSLPVVAFDGRDLPLNPGSPTVTAAAFTNNFSGATATTLYVIDSNTDRLYRMDSPDNGTLIDVGPIGINATNTNGFDIGGTSGIAYAILTVGNSTAIYTINLQTGAASKTADFPKQVKAMSVGLGF